MLITLLMHTSYVNNNVSEYISYTNLKVIGDDEQFLNQQGIWTVLCKRISESAIFPSWLFISIIIRKSLLCKLHCAKDLYSTGGYIWTWRQMLPLHNHVLMINLLLMSISFFRCTRNSTRSESRKINFW